MTIQEIIEIVAKETKVSVNDIVNPSRKQEKVLARHISMWACRWYSKSSLQKIAAAHNRRQHGSVIHASDNIEYTMKRNESLKAICQNIINQIK